MNFDNMDAWFNVSFGLNSFNFLLGIITMQEFQIISAVVGLLMQLILFLTKQYYMIKNNKDPYEEAIQHDINGINAAPFTRRCALQKAAPFFLFTFLKKNVSPAIAARVKLQNRIIDFICKVAKIDRAKIDAALRQGIVNKYGKQPEAVLNAAAKSTVAGVDGIGIVTAIAAAIPVLIDIIKKIAAFFKKSTADVPKADGKSGSDLSTLATEAQAAGEAKPAGEPSDAKVVIKPTKAQPPIVNPTPEQAETEQAERPSASSSASSASSGRDTEGSGEAPNGMSNAGKGKQNKTSEDEAGDGGETSTSGAKKDNTMLYVGIAAVAVVVLMNK